MVSYFNQRGMKSGGQSAEMLLLAKKDYLDGYASARKDMEA